MGALDAHEPVILTTSFGLLFGPVATFSILRSVNIPSITRPNTTCFPSRKSHLAVVMKNCRDVKIRSKVGLQNVPDNHSCWHLSLPTVEIRIKTKTEVCNSKDVPWKAVRARCASLESFHPNQSQLRGNFNNTQRSQRTGNLSPYMENDPVPSPFRKSPPRVRKLHGGMLIMYISP